jgi:hypothetical protein
LASQVSLMRDVDPEGHPTLGWQVIEWIETYLVHGPGDVQGEPIHLDDELATFLLRCYALDPATGRRLVDEALLSRAKGRAKSELAGMVACVEALGPARFAGWDHGEPVGRPVTYPFLRCLATEEGQAGNTYLNVTFMLSEGRDRHPEVFGGIDLGRDWQTSTRVLLPGGGEIRPSTASSAGKDGGKESFAVADETHLYTLPELVGMYRTVKYNCGKRRTAEPWMLQTTTMPAPGEGSVAEATRKAAGPAQPRLLVDHRGARRHLELADTPELRAELGWVYGAFAPAMDLDRIVGLLVDEREEEATRRRYWLNEEYASVSKAIDPRDWDQLADLERGLPPAGTPIVVGFDGSLTRDSTALRGCTKDGFLFTIGLWEAPRDSLGRPAKDWRVDEREVDQTVADAYERWQVVRGYFDPAWWASWVPTWAARHGEERVSPIWTNQEARMARWVRQVVHAITTSAALARQDRKGELIHDGDPAVGRHWANAHRRQASAKDEHGQRLWLLAKDHPNSPRKIDAAMADVLAWAARADALPGGEFDVPEETFLVAWR